VISTYQNRVLQFLFFCNLIFFKILPNKRPVCDYTIHSIIINFREVGRMRIIFLVRHYPIRNSNFSVRHYLGESLAYNRSLRALSFAARSFPSSTSPFNPATESRLDLWCCFAFVSLRLNSFLFSLAVTSISSFKSIVAFNSVFSDSKSCTFRFHRLLFCSADLARFLCSSGCATQGNK
jgi:hypothetical protein